MPAPPKCLLDLGASFLSSRTARRLRSHDRGISAQQKHFKAYLRSASPTRFGREHDFSPDLSYAEFAKNVPLRAHEAFAPYLQAMQAGEDNVLWPGHCTFYANTAGTATGSPRQVPVSDALLEHFRQAGLEAFFYYTARAGHTGVFRGRHLLLGGSTALGTIPLGGGRDAFVGDISGITAIGLPDWFEKYYYEPGAEIARILDWPAKLDAIVRRTARADIALVSGLPGWVITLASTLLERAAASGNARPTHLQALWPNLECFVHTGIPIGPFHEELRALLGPEVVFHEVYAGSEGVYAAQDAEASQGLRLLTDASLFYEFLPLEDYDPLRLGQLGPKAVPLEGVRPGVDYALILTTPAGLCRYVVGDIVRFLSTAPPRLVHAGRLELQLSTFGERLIEKELTDALTGVCKRHHWRVSDFHVAPLVSDRVGGRARGRHEWWLELRPHSNETPTGPVIAAELDADLQRTNADYAARRKTGAIDAPVVRLVMPGIFERWMRQVGKWGGQHKTPRSRNDRLIADELAALVRFSEDN